MSYENGWMYFRWVKPGYSNNWSSAPEIEFFSEYELPPRGFGQDAVVNRGGLVYITETDGVTWKPTWNSPSMVVMNAHPVLLDSNGTASIYMPAGHLFHITVADSRGEIVERCNYVKMPDWRG